MASPTVSFQPAKTTAQFQAVLQSLASFDKIEVKPIIDTLLGTTEREKCFIATYLRAAANAVTLLELKHPKHFQAINMLARGMFELAVDTRLIDVIRDGSEKILAFVDVEKLRCARKILKFHVANPAAKVGPSIYASFVKNEEKRIDALQARLWPGSKVNKLKHWSEKDMAQRVALVGKPFDEMYELNYSHLSWQVHSGLTGVVNLKAETFTTMCGCGFIFAASSYGEVLRAMIEEFKIEKAIAAIKQRMKVARALPFAATQTEIDQLLASCEP